MHNAKYKLCRNIRKLNSFLCLNWYVVWAIVIIMCFVSSFTWFNRVDVYEIVENAIRSKGLADITEEKIQAASELLVRSSLMVSIVNGIAYGLKPIIESVVIIGIITLCGIFGHSFKIIFRQCVAVKIVYIVSNTILFLLIRFMTPQNKPFNSYLPVSLGHLFAIKSATSWLYDVNIFILLDSMLLFTTLYYYRKIKIVPVCVSILIINLVWFAPKWLM